MSAIFKREFVSYFTSPVGYAVLAALMLLPVIFDNRLEGRRFKEYV